MRFLLRDRDRKCAGQGHSVHDIHDTKGRPLAGL